MKRTTTGLTGIRITLAGLSPFLAAKPWKSPKRKKYVHRTDINTRLTNTRMTVTNGKHKKPPHRFRILSDLDGFVTRCPHDGCDNHIEVKRLDHVKYHEKICGAFKNANHSHRFHVWHSPKDNTYMVSCAE